MRDARRVNFHASSVTNGNMYMGVEEIGINTKNRERDLGTLYGYLF
jgi:hypothetical protein